MRILKRNDEQRAIVIVLLRESVHFQPCIDMFLSEKDRLLKWAKTSWNSRIGTAVRIPKQCPFLEFWKSCTAWGGRDRVRMFRLVRRY